MIERWVEAKLYKSDLIPNFWRRGVGLLEVSAVHGNGASQSSHVLRLKSAEAKNDSAIAKQTDDLFRKGSGGWLQRVVRGRIGHAIPLAQRLHAEILGFRLIADAGLEVRRILHIDMRGGTVHPRC